MTVTSLQTFCKRNKHQTGGQWCQHKLSRSIPMYLLQVSLSSKVISNQVNEVHLSLTLNVLEHGSLCSTPCSLYSHKTFVVNHNGVNCFLLKMDSRLLCTWKPLLDPFVSSDLRRVISTFMKNRQNPWVYLFSQETEHPYYLLKK